MTKYLALEDVYYVSPDELEESLGYIRCSKLEGPYIQKGSMLTMDNDKGIYKNDDGEEIPIDQISVIVARDSYELKKV